MFGQCWSLNGESDALWKIYSPQKEGLLIQTTVGKFDLMPGIKLGMLAPVIYFKELMNGINEIKGNKDYDSLFVDGFLKRAAFEYEQEVRLITINDKRCVGTRDDTDGNCTHIKTALNPLEFIEKIIIDPRTDARYEETIQRYCKRAGFQIVPVKSKLYSSNVFDETGIVQKWVPVSKEVD